MNAPEQSAEDAAREARIESLGQRMVMSADLTERAHLWREMRAEIEARSVEQVIRMEREKGLL
jgi:hypothetical protein